ncbi:CTP synthase [Candidatus Uhrbacteria bacterium]|nr:CTP synthase [Candidatus Uhrbacteria bacterium]
MRKYVFVVGGVLSGVGKGVTSASLGAIFKAKGFRVTAVKADPYVNVDAGTMNPIEHGEVYVTRDGDETDQDMGNYERFLDTDLGSENYMTTGRVYQTVIQNERAMKYGGKCVQVVPHIPEEIMRRIKAADQNKTDITIIEIGGTVGEYENILFLEAARMMKLQTPDDVAFVLVSYLPVPSHLGEMKTKPTQHAARALNSVGIHANVIIARGPLELDAPRREKLAIHCGVPRDRCIAAPDVDSIYRIPLLLEKEDLGNKLLQDLDVKPRTTDLAPWKTFVGRIQRAKRDVRIAVVGKYFGTGEFTLADSYISVIESLKHAAWFHGRRPDLHWVSAEDFEKDSTSVSRLSTFDGILVPGGFGSRGIEGIVNAIRFAREKSIPYFGLCYGMQLACIEFARNVAGLAGANSVEVNPKTPHPVIQLNPLQAKNILEQKYGATMRLGSYGCALKLGSKASKAYGSQFVEERHRHRYEFNNTYRQALEEKGLTVVGVNPESDLVEIVELKDHPFFLGVQFHPEFQSRPMRPHPLFSAFMAAAGKKRNLRG